MVGNGSDLFIGYPMQMFYGYKTDGVFLTDDEVGAFSIIPSMPMSFITWHTESKFMPGR